MKPLLASASCRTVVATVVMMSWLVLSNHCALGLMSASPLAAGHEGCCGQAPAQKDGAPSAPPVRECCQSMQAVPPGIPWAVSPLQFLALLEPWLTPEADAVESAVRSGTIRVLETGPPEVRSFAELVLQHGLRSHAPPFSARS